MRLMKGLGWYWITVVWVVSVVAACGPSTTTQPPGGGTPEAQLRTRLGIPADAKRVIVFAQTAHLDIDWQRTFDDYYSRFVDTIFTEAGAILASQKRATYSIAEMAYLAHYLDVHPAALSAFRDAAARGALRVVGGGMTSPDTLLPETEMLFHDYLQGTAFSEEVLGAEGTISKGQQIRYTPQKVNRPDGIEMMGATRTAPNAHMRNFLDCIRTGRETNCPFEIGFRVSIACRMAVESYAQGRAMRWDAVAEEIV